MDVFDLVAKLSLDKSDYDSGLTEAKETSSSWGSALGTAGKTALAGIATVGTAVVGLGAGFASATSDLAEYGDNIDKSSQKLGVSAEFYQEWDAVLQHSGTSMDSMTSTFKTLANATQNTTDKQADAFEKLGLNYKDLQSLGTEELFTTIIGKLQDMESGTERTAIASTLLGKGATEMGALLNTSAEDTQGMIDKVHELGGVMSDDAVKASATFEDNLQDLQTGLTGVKNNMMAEFLPSINTVMEGLTDIVSGDKDTGLAKVNEGIDDFITNLTDSLPEIFEIGGSIVEGLGDAIIENLPELVDSASDIVMELSDKIIENLPQLMESGLEILLKLADSISENLPTLIPTIIDVILQITDTLIENTDKLIDGAIALILGLTDGLINSLPKLIEKLPELVIKIVDALIENAPKLLDAGAKMITTLLNALFTYLPRIIDKLPEFIGKIKDKLIELKDKMLDVGKNIVEGIKNGVADAWDSFKKWIFGKFEGIVDGVKDLFGIHSPSVVFKKIGEYCIEGLQEGSDELFGDEGLTATVSADVDSRNSAQQEKMDYILDILEEYLPKMATADTFSNIGISINKREFGRLVNEVS